MPFTDVELEQLYGDLAPANSSSTVSTSEVLPNPTEEEIPYKRLKQVANIIPRMIGSTAGSVNALLNPDNPNAVKESEDTIPTFNVGPDKGYLDVGLNQVAPAIASWMVPYLGATKLTKLAGLPALGRTGAGLAEAFAQGGANAFSSVGREDATPVESGLLGAASGALQATLPRWQRALPLAAVSAAHLAAGGSMMEAGANFVGNMLPGAFKSATVPTLNVKPLQEIADALAPHTPQPNFTDFAPHPRVEGTFSFMKQVPENTQIGTNDLGSLPPPVFQHTTLNELNSLQLAKDPVQMELSMEPTTDPTGLRLTHDIPQEAPTEILAPTNDATLSLEGRPLSQPELHPLLSLQGNTLDPTANFKLISGLEEAKPATVENGTGELSTWRNEAVNAPRPLALEDTKPAVEAPLAPTPAKSDALSSSVEKPTSKPKAKVAEPIVQETPHEKALAKLDEIELDPEAKKSQVIKHAEKLAKDGLINKSQIEELKRISKDKDMGVEDVASELRGTLQHGQSKSKVKVEVPEVMTPTGDFMEVKPKMEGPHIISTVLDEGDGQYLAGANWKDPHMEGGNSIFSQNIETASGVGNSAFLLQDENGIIRVTKDRVEAARIAEMAGQRSNDTVGSGALQSQHLVEPTSGAPKKPIEVLAREKTNDAKVLASSKKTESKIADLQQKLHDAVQAVKDGDMDAALEVRGLEKAIAKMRTAQMNQAGSVSPELAGVLALGGVGALVAYQQSKGDIGTTLAVALLAAGLGLGGVRGLKTLRDVVGPEVKFTGPKVKVQENLKSRLEQLAKDTAQTPGGRAVFGRGGIQANVVRMAEGLTGLNGTELFRDKKILADGFVAHQLEVLTKSLEESKPFKPSPAFSEASSRFIRGQLVDKSAVEAAIKSGGGIDSAAYSKLDKAGKAAYPEKWMVLDDPKSTNTSGPGVEVYHVSNATKTKLVEMQKDTLRNLAGTKADQEFMQFPLQARDTMDTMMQVIHNALPPGETRNKVLGTMGQYAARTHALLTDPKYYPSEVEIGRAMDRLATLKEDRFLNKYASATSIPGTVPISYKGTTHYVSAAAADEWKNLHTPEALRSLVSQYIHEIKQIAAGKVDQLISKDSQQLGSSLFARRKELDEVTQALLGTHDAPHELIQHTINKLLPTARSAHFMQDLIQMPDSRTGLKMGYRSEIEYNKAVNEIKQELNSATKTPAEIRNLETQLQELSSYLPVSGQSPRMGIFEGSYVSRTAHDQLAGFTNPFGALDNAIGHGLSHFNQVIKDTHLVANPIVHVRNAIQIPMFLAIGNAAAHPEAWKGAFDAMKNPLSKLGQRLTENGVFSGNVVHGEFNHSLHELLSGEADKNIWDKLKSARGTAHKLYAMPDNFVRAAVYLAEEARAAKKFGVLVDANDPRVMEQARLFMSRRTMDYANVSQLVKTGRQIPLVSMFLSYTSEIMRIGRNLATDALKGDLTAGATLGGLAALPFMAQSMAENNLSPEDRKAWDKTQNVVQDYSRVRFKLPMSRNKDGTFNYVDMTPLMPFNDFQMMARAAVRGDTEALGAINPFIGTEKTPLLSLFAEQITGKETHSGKEFRNAGDRAWAIAKQIVPPHTPGIGSEYEKDFPESMGGSLGVTNLRNARTNTIEGALARHLVGMDFTQVNPSIAIKNYVGAAKRDIANERQYYLDTMLSAGISADAKKRATEKFVEAVNQITGQLQARLQLQPNK